MMKENQTNKIVICQGIQGSGKSTWARKWAQEDPENRLRWNNDDMRLMMGKYWVPSRETLLSGFRVEFLLRAMRAGYDIVIDDMNLNPHTVEYYQGMVATFNASHEHKYAIEFRLFNTPLDICIARDAKREHPVSEKVIRETYNRYKELIKELDEEYYNSKTNHSERF